MLKKILHGEDIELTYGQLVLVGIGAIALGTFVYFWLSGELWQWGNTWTAVDTSLN